MGKQSAGVASRSFIYFDPEMDLYEPFLKDPDGATLLTAGAGTRLEPALDDLVQDWRGAHYARGMPWLLTRASVDSAAGALQRELPEFSGTALFDALQRRMHSTHLRLRDRRELVRVIEGLKAEVGTALKREQQSPPTRDDYLRAWKTYLAEKSFPMALEASERAAYLTLYFAYENFVARGVELRSGSWPSSTRRIGDGLLKEFGKASWDRCWDQGVVAAARHVRDAFAHRGGRANSETQAFGSLVNTDRGWIVIGARDTNALYAGLFGCVIDLLAEFRKLDLAGAGPTP